MAYVASAECLDPVAYAASSECQKALPKLLIVGPKCGAREGRREEPDGLVAREEADGLLHLLISLQVSSLDS